MTTFIISFVVMALFFVLMGIGLILRNKPIKGTCASLSTIGLNESCEICGGDRNKCDNAAEGSEPGPSLPAKPELYAAARRLDQR